MFNFRDKNFKIIIIGLIVVLASIFTVFLYTKNQQNLSEEVLQEQNVFVSVGYVEQTQLTLDNGDRVPIFVQAYNIRDMYGGMVDSDKIKLVQVKYPRVEEFYDLPDNFVPDGAIFKLIIWPQENSGKYVFRIEYEDGTIREETVNWQGLIKKPAILTPDRRTESDGTSSKAYKIEDLDLSSFEEMYHIRPNTSLTRIEIPQDEYFWLKDSDRTLGKHTILIKKDNAWYQSTIIIAGKGIF